MKLFNYTSELGDTVLFECEARIENNAVVVYFIKKKE